MTRRPIISLMLCLLLWRLAVVTTACPPPECPDCYYPEGDTCKYICTDCVAPTAGFTVWPATDNRYVCIDDAVTFSAWAHSDDADGCLDSYSWTFGVDAYDISGDDGSWESCRYSTVGDKTVELTVWDDDCSCCCAYDSDCCADNPDCYDKSDTFNRTVTVLEVASLLPDTGTEFDDGDGDSNTKSFAVCVGTGVVTVTATPDPNVSEENLPGYGYTWGWTLEGGTGTSLLSRTVDKTTAGATTITCTCGSSSKTTKIYVVEVASVTADSDGGCINCDFYFTATTNPPDKYACLQWSGGGTPATGSGETFTTRWCSTGTKTVTASCSGSSKSTQVTLAAPTNFREVRWEDLGDGRLRFYYEWDSTSGDLFDLIGCMVGEKVDYPGEEDPYVWPDPWVCSSDNPIVNNHEAIDGGLFDTHHHGDPSAPYTGASFTATQVFRYRDCQENYTTLLGPISIMRVISGEDPLWRYSIIKSGGYAEIFPLP